MGDRKANWFFIIATPIVMESYVHLDCTDAKISLVNGW